VHCRTCRTEHAYKGPKGLKAPAPKGAALPGEKKKSSSTKAPKEEAVPVEQEWVKLMNANREHPLKKYSAKTAFVVGDRIQHPTFGDGVVKKLVYPNKIEVVFQMDMKVLIHGGSAGA
jgi:hypothetical protein